VTQLTPHFSLEELTTRRGIAGADLARLTSSARASLVRLAEVLEVVRAEVGRPVRVTSAYRHGDPRQHGQGQAADVQVDGLSPLELLAIVRELHKAGRLPHQLRQVIAESSHADPASVYRPMIEAGGLWLHIAIRGLRGQPFDDATSGAWLLSYKPMNEQIYRSAT
jgi:hypothetical protein